MGKSSGKTATTSKLLMEEEPLQVLPALAVALGLNEAIVLQQLHYWLRKKPHHRDGRDWHYNRYVDWQKQFPFWSISTIKRTMVSLEKSGAVTTANYNNSPIDKTKWYAINYDKLNEICESPTAQNEPSTAQNEPSTAQNEPSTDQVEPSTAQNEPLHGSNCSHQFPENNTENKTQDPDLRLSPPYSPPPQSQNGCVGVYEVGQDVTAASFNQPLKEQAKEVLAHLNQVTGRLNTNLAFITALLETKVSVADCKLVIDWWQAVKIVEQPSQRVNFNASTPFKLHLFAEYLPLAKQWDEQGRGSLPQSTTTQYVSTVEARRAREEQAKQRFLGVTDARSNGQRPLLDRDESVIDGIEYRVE